MRPRSSVSHSILRLLCLVKPGIPQDRQVKCILDLQHFHLVIGTPGLSPTVNPGASVCQGSISPYHLSPPPDATSQHLSPGLRWESQNQVSGCHLSLPVVCPQVEPIGDWCAQVLQWISSTAGHVLPCLALQALVSLVVTCLSHLNSLPHPDMLLFHVHGPPCCPQDTPGLLHAISHQLACLAPRLQGAQPFLSFTPWLACWAATCPSLCFLCFDVLTAPAPSRYTHTTFLTYWFIACLLQQNVRWTRTSILFILIALASAAGRMPNSEQSHNEYLLNGFKEWVVEIISITFRRIQCYGLLRQKCHRSSYHVHRTNVVTLAWEGHSGSLFLRGELSMIFSLSHL